MKGEGVGVGAEDDAAARKMPAFISLFKEREQSKERGVNVSKLKSFLDNFLRRIASLLRLDLLKA